MLPDVPDEAPEDRATRELRAMDAVVALHPQNDFEARLAVRIVAMDAHVADALQSAARAVNDPAEMRRSQSQAVSMSRQADASTRMLLRLEATREKQEAALLPPAMRHAPPK